MLPATASPGEILGISILMSFDNFNTTPVLNAVSLLLALTLLRGAKSESNTSP